MEKYLEQLRADGTVKVKDWQKVTEKLQRIGADGLDHVHIISDFDMTMTKYWHEGQRSASSHGILIKSPHLGEDFKQRSGALYNKYYPIEIDMTVAYEDKVKAMVEWWTKAHDLIMEYNLYHSHITEMVQKTPVTFREHIRDLLESCFQKNIPFLVFSAGLYDVIKEILLQSNLWFSNMHIISNKMVFNDEGKCVAFSDPLIHVLNKNEACISNKSYHDTIENRRNVILLGDSLGDLKMSEGLTHDTQLTIGFLNHDEDALINNYLDAFDIVITQDASLSAVLSLLKQLAV